MEFAEFLESIEPWMEIVNFAIAFLIIVTSLSGLKKAGGMIKTAWILVILTSAFFVIVEFKNVLKEWHILVVEDGDLLETAAVGFLYLAVRKLKQLF